jgi:hypothetical protein
MLKGDFHDFKKKDYSQIKAIVYAIFVVTCAKMA